MFTLIVPGEIAITRIGRGAPEGGVLKAKRTAGAEPISSLSGRSGERPWSPPFGADAPGRRRLVE